MTRKELTRRERQIMDVIHRRGEATVAEVRDGMPSPPSYSAVRATMNTLEEKGILRHRKDGRRFVYAPRTAPERARRNALLHLVRTFFAGSTEGAVASLLEMKGSRLGPDALARLREKIDEAERGGR